MGFTFPKLAGTPTNAMQIVNNRAIPQSRLNPQNRPDRYRMMMIHHRAADGPLAF